MHIESYKPIVALLTAIFLGSCNVAIPNGVFSCLDDSECPGGMFCWNVDDYCYDTEFPECTPRTCEQALEEFAPFGITCGIFPDNCGGSIECNIEGCDCEDVFEENDSPSDAQRVCPGSTSCTEEEQIFDGPFDIEFGPDTGVVLNFDADDDEDWFEFHVSLRRVQASAVGLDGLANLSVGAQCGPNGNMAGFACSTELVTDVDGVRLCVGTADNPNPTMQVLCMDNSGDKAPVRVFLGMTPTNYQGPMCQDYAGEVTVTQVGAGDVLPGI